MNSQTILLIAAEQPDATITSALEDAGFPVRVASYDADPVSWRELRFAVVDATPSQESAAAFVRRWRAQPGGQDLPLIWLVDALDPFGRSAGWQAGADAVLVRPLAVGELAAQLARLARWREEHERLAERAGETSRINQTLIELYGQIDADFRIARRIQRSCRPSHLPTVGRARFAVSHRERAGSAGDFYNVVRVDERNVAFLLGDVLGGSLTACMLAVFLHQNITPKDIEGQKYRVISPDEVLRRLNRQLAALGMPDPPMVRLTYGILDTESGHLSFSVAGHTPPLHLPTGGPATLLRGAGPLLGPTDAEFPVRQLQLDPGDRLILFTDGLDGTSPEQADMLLAGSEALRSLPLPSMVESLTQSLLTQTLDPDDFTMLALEYGA